MRDSPDRSSWSCHAFTLVEILFVITILVVAVGLLSFGLKPSTARQLNDASNLLYGKLREARGVAAMRQNHARLLIHADARQRDYAYRALAIVVETEPGSQQWELVDAPELLPEGIRFVPMATKGGSSAGPFSAGGKEVELSVNVGAWLQNANCLAFEFKPTGRISNVGYDCYLAEGSTLENGSPVFKNLDNLRGLRVNDYGLVSGLVTAKMSP